MNINYINESVISVAVMSRKHTHLHTQTHIYREQMQGQQGQGSEEKMFVVFQQSEASEYITENLANSQ